MGTVELIIVFSALMALIALLTIGIDWIGKPLRNRRFIPRMYRFDDEKLPVDQYGHTQLGPLGPVGGMGTPVGAAGTPSTQPPPVVVAQLPAHAEPAPADLTLQGVPVVPPAHQPAPQTRGATPSPPRSASAFSDSLLAADDGDVGRGVAVADGPSELSRSTGERRVWRPGMALDATIDDRKPNLATKAERFWKATGQTQSLTHFDNDDRRRMASGKAPRRRNPRTGRMEVMQLTGLRQASRESQVRMRWPDDSVDPWNAR
jgi:hypothetical protein